MAVTSRSQLTHPDLGTAGGSALWNQINTIYAQLGDQDLSRYSEFTSVADSTTSEIDHNLGENIDNLEILIFTGTGSTKIPVVDFVAAGWVVGEKTGEEKTVLEVTTPGSGGPHDFTVIILEGATVRQRLIEQVATAPANPATAGVLKEYWDSNGRGLAKDSSGNIYLMQSLNPVNLSGAGTATPGQLYKADTSGGGFTHTLPATVNDYDVIDYVDALGTWNSDNLTLARNGNNINGEASDFVGNQKNQALRLIGDASAGNWIMIDYSAGSGSGEGGTNYFTNGLFESDVTTGVTITQGATVTAETTDPLQGIQSALVTQDNSATVADVRFAISGIDNYVIDGGIVPLSEALITCDAADADGDVTYGIYNETDAVWVQGPVDLLGGGVLNVVRELCSNVLLDGKTYVGRLLRTDSTDTRAVIVDRLRLDPTNGGAVVPLATATSPGVVYTPKSQTKELTSNISSSTADISNFNNLEVGKVYKASFLGMCTINGSPSSEVTITLNHDGAGLTFVQHREVGGATTLVASLSFDWIFTATTNKVQLNATIGSGGTLETGSNSTWFRLEELPGHTLTTDWT